MENTIEKLADFKKLMKTFVKGVVKSGVFGGFGDEKAIEFEVIKNESDKVVTISTTKEMYTAVFEATVSTRVINKVTDELFTSIISQLASRKNFNGVTFTIK